MLKLYKKRYGTNILHLRWKNPQTFVYKSNFWGGKVLAPLGWNSEKPIFCCYPIINAKHKLVDWCIVSYKWLSIEIPPVTAL